MTKKPNMSRRSGRRGVTLIEAVLYISIALALIVGGLVFYRQASFASNFNSMNRLLTATVAEARVIVREMPKPVFPTVIIPVPPATFETILISSGSIPSAHLDMTQPEGGRIRSVFGGSMSFFAAVYVSTSGIPSTVAVTLRDLPVEACTRLSASSAAGQTSFATGLENGTITDNSLPGSQSLERGETVGTAGTKCKASDLDGDGKVVLTLVLGYLD
jgi:hypothetical protein